MAAWQPRLEELPSEFAVFPLEGALLLPRGRLPLNIFEPRYLAMVEDALAAGRMFGMIQPDPIAPEGPAGPGLYRVGCLGRISYFSETEDGRLLITLTGLLRFEVMAELEPRRGYRRVRADFTRFLGDVRPPFAEAAGAGRAALLAATRGFFARRALEVNWEALGKLPEATLAITLAMSCPFTPAEKQAILEASNEAERIAALVALLQMGAAGGEEPGRKVS